MRSGASSRRRWADPGDVVEVEPPERGGAQERQAEGHGTSQAQREVGRRRARDDNRLTQRDDHEELEALCEVLGADLPSVLAEARLPRDPVDDEWSAVVDSERGDPQRRPRRSIDESAGKPQRAGSGEPDEDAARALPLDRAAVRDDEREEEVSPDLDRDVRPHEQQGTVAERLRDGDSHQEAREHQADHEEPHHD